MSYGPERLFDVPDPALVAAAVVALVAPALAIGWGIARHGHSPRVARLQTAVAAALLMLLGVAGAFGARQILLLERIERVRDELASFGFVRVERLGPVITGWVEIYGAPEDGTIPDPAGATREAGLAAPMAIGLVAGFLALPALHAGLAIGARGPRARAPQD